MSEKGDNSAELFTEFCQTLISSFAPYLAYKLYVSYHDPSSGSSPDILFTRSFISYMSQSEKGNNLVKYAQNL